MVVAGREDVTAIIQIPKSIPKANLLKSMPLTWLTNYEKEHAVSRLVHTTITPDLFSLSNGTVKTIFKNPKEEQQKPSKEIFKRIADLSSSTTIYQSMMS